MRLLFLSLVMFEAGNVGAETKWVKTDPADLADGDVVVIYDMFDRYAMKNDGGTSTPKALKVTLSTDKTHEFIESGSTANCYRIGDYVFKLSSTKWSYEDIICPDLYLILRNLEEDFIRNDKGIVVAAIEIQKYLKRTARNIPIITLKLFRDELDRLGYYTTDSLMNGPCGDNCRLLDDYKESGELNPPDWFKETPLVLVDRDRVYRKDNIYPKQLRSYD